MKVGDTVRIGGIPVVLVKDEFDTVCTQCAFNGMCNALASSHKIIVAWERHMGNDCARGGYHYEVRV